MARKRIPEQVKRIRSVHVLNATAAIRMAWQRLEECYGAPEVIENALLKKIENIQKLSNKDNHKLRELGDILLELVCAKADGYLPGLAYLDTPRGVSPIVEKLPTNLQDKWIVQGSKYKEDYQVAFPPFAFLSQFVRSQAKIRNEPSFSFSSSSYLLTRAVTVTVGCHHGCLLPPAVVHVTSHTL